MDLDALKIDSSQSSRDAEKTLPSRSGRRQLLRTTLFSHHHQHRILKQLQIRYLRLEKLLILPRIKRSSPLLMWRLPSHSLHLLDQHQCNNSRTQQTHLTTSPRFTPTVIILSSQTFLNNRLATLHQRHQANLCYHQSPRSHLLHL